MRFRTCSALLLLLLLSACATTEPSLGEQEDPNPRFANLQRAAQYPWTDDGHCVVREVSNESTPEEREEWRNRCLDYYVRCSEFVKGDKQWRVYGERQCQSCWLLCERTGQWPAEANEKPCPEGD